MKTLEIEKKWQDYWDKNKSFVALNDSQKEKYYYLIEFPYPSGAGLHVGHVRSYTALDVMARKKRMLGFNVLYPIGFDAFGLPTEQYAIKNKIHPSLATKINIETFKKQIKRLGISFDWSREFSTTDPAYYKWTQWQFLKFYEHNLAYKEKKEINWCNNCKIGLSNEEAEGNICERCSSPVTKKLKEQWMLKMSSYAEKLLDGLEETAFIDRVKTAQINWIGKSKGAIISFKIKDIDDKIDVYTTRPDTIYGVTFMVIAFEHPFIDKYKDLIKNYDEVIKYREEAIKKSDIERTDNTKEKTGVCLEGIKAINPLTNEEISVFVSDYVLMNYATGSIMAVPAHDERDYQFAKKFNLKIVPVIEGGDISVSAYIKEGKLINSKILDGITNKKEAIDKMIKYLEENNLGYAKTNYKLQDWVFSRQRFWGEPIPIIHCKECGIVPVPYEDLPVVLPDVAKYEPTDNAESPLALIEEWINVSCPKCGGKAKRETDTMPNWAGSSWYYLRYMDNLNDSCFASLENMKYWNMVDFYNGGMEHATRHLLYARFWHRFLYDIGLVPYKEPFKKRVAHGMILGSNGVKMSKSLGNVINPDNMVDLYGADSLRVYEMFMGDYEQEVAWNEFGLKGCKRFIEKVIKLSNKVIMHDNYSSSLEILINQTIKKVSEDIDNMKYNTAISALMILVNNMEENKNITSLDYQTLLILLYPFAPHITSELNEQVLKNKDISTLKWPIYDENKLTTDTYEMVVQVNGKVRGKVIVSNDISKEQMYEEAIKLDNVKLNIEGKEIINKIIILGKLVNIVVKER